MDPLLLHGNRIGHLVPSVHNKITGMCLVSMESVKPTELAPSQAMANQSTLTHEEPPFNAD